MFNILRPLSLTLIAILLTGTASCVKETPAKKQETKDNTANVTLSQLSSSTWTANGPFTSITQPGVYSGTDTQTPVAVRTYESGIDQTSFSKSSSSRAWSIFNLSNGTFVTLTLSAVSVVSGSTIETSVNMNGEVSTDSLTVVKTSGSNAWLENKKSKVGYIITLQ